MVEVYWKIGERIVIQEQGGESRAAYGEQILKELSITLTSEFAKVFLMQTLEILDSFILLIPTLRNAIHCVANLHGVTID